MTRFQRQQQNGETGGFAVAGEEIAPATATEEPELRIGVQLVRALKRLPGLFLRFWGAPPAGVTETQLGRNHLAYRSVGEVGIGGIRIGAELQLSCVYHLDIGDLDGDDDAAGKNGGLLGKTDDRVVLTQNS